MKTYLVTLVDKVTGESHLIGVRADCIQHGLQDFVETLDLPLSSPRVVSVETMPKHIPVVSEPQVNIA